MSEKSAIILANGAFPSHQVPLKELKHSEYIVCCDGAATKLVKFGIAPFAIVGDLDSLDKTIGIDYHDIVYHISDQETNDLTKAVNWCVQNNFEDITIVGATGQREDHTLGNIFLLPLYAQMIKVRMLTDHGVFTPILQSQSFVSYSKQQVSIFATQSSTPITTTDLRYPLAKRVLDFLWQGTLNESLGDSFRIEFEGGPLVIFQEY